jgi:hypothetical protein
VYQQEVLLTTVDDLKLIARSEDIAVGGMSIICDQVSAAHIMPSNQPLPNDSFNLLIEVYLNGVDQSIQGLCSIRNRRRLAEDKFSFNLKFISYKGQSEQLLESFMKQQKVDI